MTEPMSWEDGFLNWFSEQGIPLTEKSVKLGGYSYHQFTSACAGVRGDEILSFGCSSDRRSAALKCTAEMMERKLTDEFFQSAEDSIPATFVDPRPGVASPATEGTAPLPPPGLRNSNGWAVHSSVERAKAKAFLEAMERHLLIKSFYRWGWQGFRLVQEIQAPEAQIFFMTSRLNSGGLVGGLVASKSPLYAGLSFGYCVGPASKTGEAAFWENALLESISKILTLSGRPLEVRPGPGSWLQAETKTYLESPFDLDVLKLGKDLAPEDEGPKSYWLKGFDLTQAKALPLSLGAAFCWGGSLIPLCSPAHLDGAGLRYFESLLQKNSLPGDVPTRHPIL